MRETGYLVAGLAVIGLTMVAACGEAKREFVADNALQNVDAAAESAADASALGEDDGDDTPPASTEAQTGHVPAPHVPGQGDSATFRDAAVGPDGATDGGLTFDGAPEAAVPETATADATVWPRSECELTEYDALSINEPADFPGVRNIYFYGDGVTTACVTQNRGQICIEGNAPVSSDGVDEFKNWGMGLGMYLATSVPFDAAAQGIAKVRFSLTNVVGRSVRIALTQTPDPNITDDSLNYQNNAFVYGGSEVNDVASDMVVTAALGDFALPPWTHVSDPSTSELAVGQVLNPAQLASLQVQIVNGLGEPAKMYSYCVSDVQWLDANDAKVEPIVPGAGTIADPATSL